MINADLVWLASYPRSGNTLLRTILWHCFGIPSTSIYPNDLGGNGALEGEVGHYEFMIAGRVSLPYLEVPFLKTHEHPSDDNPAIYLVRDGRPACVSFWRFFNGKIPLEDIITGKDMLSPLAYLVGPDHPSAGQRAGTWAEHLYAWKPWERPKTLLLRYEDMTTALHGVLGHLSVFLDCPPIGNRIPLREDLAKLDGRWIRRESRWRESMSRKQEELFNRVNGEMMEKLGYASPVS